MNKATSLTGLLVVWVLFTCPGCECQSRGPAPVEDTAGREGSRLEKPVLDDGEQLTDDQRLQTTRLIALVKRYYPTWDPAHESRDDFYTRWYDAPEIQRFNELIQRHVENDHAWQAFLNDVQGDLGHDVRVRDGAPPMFYIPSFQIVIHGKHPRGTITMVFRLSMLAPLYDYYEHIRSVRGRWLESNLIPSRETANIARQVRGLIADHYPAYRELPPQIGSVRVRNVKTENKLLNQASLADALFEDTRTW